MGSISPSRAGEQKFPACTCASEDLEALHRLLRTSAPISKMAYRRESFAIEEPRHAEEEGAELVLDVAGTADQRHRLVLELRQVVNRESAGRSLPWTCSKWTVPSPRPPPGDAVHRGPADAVLREPFPRRRDHQHGGNR
jgi:hypothetical protein